MATRRSSPSLVSCDRASSTAHDQTPLATDIELVTLAPAVDNAVSEHSRQISFVNLGVTRGSTAVATYPTGSKTKALREDASPLQSDRPSIVRRLILDSWLCECVAMCFSIGCLIAVVFVVEAYDGKRIPELVSGLTLNAIISVLSAASRASLVYVVSVTLGQLKWCWLKKSTRQIHDIQAIDDASRGPLGAFGVLAFWTGGSLAALGSVITLLMIAFGPFLQQVVAYPSRNTTQPDGFALAPRNLAYTHHLPPDDGWAATSPWQENSELSNALEAGVWSSPKPFDREPICSTGRCSWPKFQSVGWCSKCENRTSSATIKNCKLSDIIGKKNNVSDYCVLTLGDGANFSLFRDLEMSTSAQLLLIPHSSNTTEVTEVRGNHTSGVIWPLSYGNSGADLSVLDAPELSSEPTNILGLLNPLIAIGEAIVHLDSRLGVGNLDYNLLQVVEATQCILNPCEKTLSLIRANGTTTWNDEFTNYGSIVARNVSLPSPSIIDRVTTLCWQAEDGDLDLTNTGNKTYVADRNKRAFCPVEDYAFHIQKSLQGQWNTRFDFQVAEYSKSVFQFGWSGNGDPYQYRSERFNTVGPQSTRNLSQRAESIAVALTNWGLQTTNETCSGDAIGEESYVHARWQWIILPAFLELASLALLVLTIIHSRRKDVPLWKTSALALIYHAVDELRGEETMANERLSGMELTAKTTDVQLLKNEDGLNSLSKRSGYRPVDQDG